MTVTVRPITVEDTAGFRACLDIIAREKRYLAQLEALPLQRFEGFVRDTVESDGSHFVAVDEGRVVGWADVIADWADAVKHCGRVGMGVLAAYRGQGLGERLLRAAIAKAAANGITRIELDARADNAAAIALYHKVGFVHEALKRRAMKFDGVYHDAAQMCLLLQDR